MSEPGAETPPTPEKTEIERFIDALAGFDPAALLGKVDALGERIGQLDLVKAVQEAIETPIAELTKAVNDLRKQVNKQTQTPEPPTPPSEPPVPPEPPTPTPADNEHGVASTLFGIPRLP